MSGGLSGSLGFILVRYGGTQAQHKPLGIVRASFCEALNRVDEISVPCKTSFGNCAAVIGNSSALHPLLQRTISAFHLSKVCWGHFDSSGYIFLCHVLPLAGSPDVPADNLVLNTHSEPQFRQYRLFSYFIDTSKFYEGTP